MAKLFDSRITEKIIIDKEYPCPICNEKLPTEFDQTQVIYKFENTKVTSYRIHSDCRFKVYDCGFVHSLYELQDNRDNRDVNGWTAIKDKEPPINLAYPEHSVEVMCYNGNYESYEILFYYASDKMWRHWEGVQYPASEYPFWMLLPPPPEK